MPLTPLSEAVEHVLTRVAALPVEERLLEHALGAVTAEAVVAREAVPPFANSAMDGYAVRAVDTRAAPVALRVVGTVAAGAPASRGVGPGEAMRIMTGAPVPDGVDAVVLVERTHTQDDVVTVEITVEPGTSIRQPAEDVAPGDTVVPEGVALTPAHLGVLASVGVERVVTHRTPRVGVLVTGDELVEQGRLGPGQIRNSNGPALRALVRESGFEVVDLGIAPDDETALTATLERAVVRCDAVLTTGGVSMGDLDLVKVTLDRIGDMRWMQVAIKPAKPFAFGLVSGVPVFGLPGNPVSSLVFFELFARPALRRMAGHRHLERPVVRASAPEGLRRRPDGKIHFVRVVAELTDGERWTVCTAGGQGSHQLAAMAGANALAIVPDGDGVAPGDPVEAMLFAWV